MEIGAKVASISGQTLIELATLFQWTLKILMCTGYNFKVIIIAQLHGKEACRSSTIREKI
jgi:hypothetical protein